MQLYHKEHVIFSRHRCAYLRLTESHFSALDKKNNLLQFRNVLTPERWGYEGILLKFTSRLPLQLHFLHCYDSADGSVILTCIPASVKAPITNALLLLFQRRKSK